MDTPLLATKLHAPARRPTAISRSWLTQRLAKPGRLVLVAAPAGFGKTSILNEWLSVADGFGVGWISLDDRDNEPNQFWRYLLAAVDRADPGSAGAASQLLRTAPTETMLETLVNDLDARNTEVLLILDDYHVIENPVIHSGVAFLIENLPRSAHVVIASRADPPLPLARLRARGELTELRAAELRFTPAETSEYLNHAMGLSIGDQDIARLSTRTEGWIAALQLAALSLQGREDASGFIAGFAGDDRFVVDYLVEEVLQNQAPETREFLLRTSVLERLSGELCDSVAERSGSAAVLIELDRTNLFVIPLDDHREWYRYHHLFGEMLRARLLDEHPGLIGDLHVRASQWYEDHGHTADAIDHAIKARAFDQAARMMKAAAPGMQQLRQEITLAAWFDLLPPDLVQADPELGLTYAGVLLSSGRTDGVDRLLRDAELAAGGGTTGVLALGRGVALYRAARALSSDEVEAALKHSEVAVRLAADGNDLDRGSAYGVRGLVLWAAGDLESARAAWATSLDELKRAGHLADVLGGSLAMADILIAQGRLTDAEALYRRGLELAATSSPPLRGAADMHVGLADVLRERGDLEGARQHLATAEEFGEFAGLPQNRHRRRMAAARLLLSDGDAASGISLLDEAERLYTPDFFPEVQPIPALRARLALAAGRTAAATEWRRRRKITPDDDLSYRTEFDHITLARVLLRGDADDVDAAGRLLERLLVAAETGQRTGAIIELLALRSLAFRREGRTSEALACLERAIRLSAPEGYERVYADEGEPMAHLLGALAKKTGDAPYLRRVRTAAAAAASPGRSLHLADPLSERELEVLRLLATELSGPEISRHLVVSVNTLRTHTKNIFSKLGATSRRQAVARAVELGLLNSPG